MQPSKIATRTSAGLFLLTVVSSFPIFTLIQTRVQKWIMRSLAWEPSSASLRSLGTQESVKWILCHFPAGIWQQHCF